MHLFRKPIHTGFLAAAVLGGMLLGWGSLGWTAQKQWSSPIGGNQSSPPSGNSAPSRASQPSTGGAPLSAPSSSLTVLDETLAAMEGGTKRHISFLPPFTEKELLKAVKHHKKHLSKVLRRVEERGLAFDLTPKIKAALRKAGADANFIASLHEYTPSERATASAGALALASKVSRAEARAYRRVTSQTHPGKRIQEAEAFIRKFPKSVLLSYVYSFQAGAYWEKNAPRDVMAACQKSLALKPDNLTALLLLTYVLPQPQMLANLTTEEKQRRLSQAESYARQALQELERRGKGEIAGGVYASLGMVHLERSSLSAKKPDLAELDKAEHSFKKAIEKSKGSAGNAAYYFRLGEVYALENKLDAAISAYSRAKSLAPGTVIEQQADRHIMNLKQKQPHAQLSQP